MNQMTDDTEMMDMKTMMKMMKMMKMMEKKMMVEKMKTMEKKDHFKMMKMHIVEKMATIEVLTEREVHPMMAWSKRSKLPCTVIYNTQTNALVVPPALAELDPQIFEKINLEDPSAFFRGKFWTVEQVKNNIVQKTSLENYVALLPDRMPFDMYAHATPWSMFHYVRNPDGSFIDDWTLTNPPKVNPGCEKGLWEDTPGDEHVNVYRTMTWMKMWRGDFDGLEY